MPRRRRRHAGADPLPRIAEPGPQDHVLFGRARQIRADVKFLDRLREFAPEYPPSHRWPLPAARIAA